MKKISLKDVKNGLKRDEMRMVIGGGCGNGSCKLACTVVSSSSECCSGMAVSGAYVPCGSYSNDGPKVCL